MQCSKEGAGGKNRKEGKEKKENSRFVKLQFRKSVLALSLSLSLSLSLTLSLSQ